MRSISSGLRPTFRLFTRHVLDRVVRVDDERRAQRHALVLVAHAELVDERAGRVGELPVVRAFEVLVLAAPAELAELVVGRAAEQHRVAVLELLRELAKPAISVGQTNVKSFG